MTQPDPSEDAQSVEEAILRNVHPGDWKNPEPKRRYDLVAIGGGTAGLTAVTDCIRLGGRAALVEKRWMGGEGLNVGYVPSKAFIRSSRVGENILKAVEFGWTGSDRVLPDFTTAMRRIRRLMARISSRDSAEHYQSLGVDVFFGEARFVDRRSVEVEGRRLFFRKALIATGAQAVHPFVPGLAETGYLTNENVFQKNVIPRRMAVIGGGAIGCELAQAFRRLGCSEIALLDSGFHFLPREDPDAAEVLRKVFEREGIRLVFQAKVTRAGKAPGGKILHFESAGREDSLEVDEILVATGRAPCVRGLNLEAAGVAYDARGGVKVDDFLRTTAPGIYAAGDVCSAFKFAHMAHAGARLAVANALEGRRERFSRIAIPWCTYTDPEIAHVGMYEQEAKGAGLPVRTLIQPFSEVARAVLNGEADGFLKVHVREDSGRILGATLVSRHAGEMISEITTAMVAGLAFDRLADVVHPFPTISEAFQRLAYQYRCGRKGEGRIRVGGASRRKKPSPTRRKTDP